MTDQESAEAQRRALIDAALAAHEDAGLRGLCAEGRWEAAVDAMRSLAIARQPVAELSASVSAVTAALAGTAAPPPGGGSVAAFAGALAAALTQLVARLTFGRPRYAHVADEMQDAAQRAVKLATELSALVERDAAAYEGLAAACRLPRGTEQANSTRVAAIERALLPATEAPLQIARATAAVAKLAAQIAERGNTNAVADAAVAAMLADAACRAAGSIVRVNAAALHDARIARGLRDEAVELGSAASAAAARAIEAVERAG